MRTYDDYYFQSEAYLNLHKVISVDYNAQFIVKEF